MRLISLSLCAGILLFASTGALANRPVTTLPSGATVDLNTGIVTTVDGKHYTLSPARLKQLRTGLTGGDANTSHQPVSPAATAAAAKAKRKSTKKGPPR